MLHTHTFSPPCFIHGGDYSRKIMTLEENNKTENDKLTEELVDILKSEIVALAACNWRPSSYENSRIITDESINAFVEHLCLSLGVKNIYDLPKSRFWEAMLLIRKDKI